ncbi:Hypothetical protein SMAX5B_001179 [Scophthalmus maximus]|uniref:Uncharacterized protein n=1 Tax=Scophthalmus maximus TaxID=52904 RepID=A0A2U9CAG7_SCOMX|nr:Hypothetical protein SMAX5B_001179 [Scophthalmus maximus]
MAEQQPTGTGRRNITSRHFLGSYPATSPLLAVNTEQPTRPNHNGGAPAGRDLCSEKSDAPRTLRLMRKPGPSITEVGAL